MQNTFMFRGQIVYLEVSEYDPDGNPIEYFLTPVDGDLITWSFTTEDEQATHAWFFNLTTENQWVCRGHLKQDDVRMTVIYDTETHNDDVPPTEAERVMMLLLGQDPWEEGKKEN